MWRRRVEALDAGPLHWHRQHCLPQDTTCYFLFHFGDAELLEGTGTLSSCRPRQATDVSVPASSPRPSLIRVRGCVPALGPAPCAAWEVKVSEAELLCPREACILTRGISQNATRQTIKLVLR